MAIFQVNLGWLVFIEAKDDGGGGDNWTTGGISRVKLQSNHHHQQTNIQMQVSIKPICDWSIYLTACVDERPACITQTSFSLHYIVYESISCNHGTKYNYCQLRSHIHHRATYLSLPPYLSYYN